MQNGKTISYLNSKMWYRFVKVSYAISFLVILSFSILLIVDENKPRKILDNDTTEIACKYGNKKTFTAKIIGVTVYDYPEFKFASWDNDKILKFCNAENEKIEVTNFATDQKVQTDLKNFIGAGYDIKPSYKNEGSYSSMIFYILLSFIGTLLFFEIIRRTFYYIVLGKIFPKKKNESDNLS